MVSFLIEYYTRTYSMIFDFILNSDVQYDFWEKTILGRIVWFLILYCTATYNTIFDYKKVPIKTKILELGP